MRWNESAGKPRPRTQHRALLTRSFGGVGPLTAIYASNEFLLELDGGGRGGGNRLVPEGLTLRLSGSPSMDLFYMARSSHAVGHWSHDHIAGVVLKRTL